MSDELAWDTIDSRVDYACPGFDVIRESVRLPTGTETDFHYVNDEETVVIIPFTTNGLLVLIDEWRQAVKRTNRALPAGNVEPDDSDLRAAAERELAEETGYQANTFESLISVEPANGIADAINHYFLATGCEPTGAPTLDTNESIRPVTVNYEELLEAIRTGDIRDGRTVLGLCYFELMTDGQPRSDRSETS